MQISITEKGIQELNKQIRSAVETADDKGLIVLLKEHPKDFSSEIETLEECIKQEENIKREHVKDHVEKCYNLSFSILEKLPL